LDSRAGAERAATRRRTLVGEFRLLQPPAISSPVIQTDDKMVAVGSDSAEELVVAR